jgi:hypothetical protein
MSFLNYPSGIVPHAPPPSLRITKSIRDMSAVEKLTFLHHRTCSGCHHVVFAAPLGECKCHLCERYFCFDCRAHIRLLDDLREICRSCKRKKLS